MKPTISIRKWIAAFRSRDDGVAAIEFGLFSPILFFSLLATIDIGMAVNERMIVDQALRAGAEQAMYDVGATGVQTVAEDAAKQAFSVGGSGGSLGAITVNVTRYCACPGSTAQVACSTVCTGSVSPYQYYDLSAQKTFDGIIIPSMTFNSNMTVMVR